MRPGPPIEVLTRRLAETPADFLALPAHRSGEAGIAVDAVVSDLLVLLGAGPLTGDTAPPFRPGSADVLGDQAAVSNRLRAVLVTAWLLADPWFVDTRVPADAVLALLTTAVPALADQVQSATLVSDPDRREELARSALAALGFVPAGETEAQATDRLATLDSVERARVLAATREAELRAAAVRQAMHEKAAAEAAAKASRE
jgi:hypothetical protein